VKNLASLLALFLATAIAAAAENKGHCPPNPPPPASVPKNTAPPPTSPDKTYVGTVTVFLVVSDTGHVCNAKVLRGVDQKTDAEALDTLRKWHFDPAQKNGRAVPVAMTATVTYWRDKEGKLVQAPTAPSAIQQGTATSEPK